MRRPRFRVLALSAFAAAFSLAVPALAGSPYYDVPGAAQTADRGAQPVPQRREGHFTCSYNEVRTRLERKNCGGARY